MPTNGDKTNNVDDLTEDDHDSTLQSERGSESSQTYQKLHRERKYLKEKRETIGWTSLMVLLS